MRVKNTAGEVLIEDRLDKFSSFTFNKPSEDYRVEFDAGEGHLIVIEGKSILE
jgi:hypothetical protein